MKKFVAVPLALLFLAACSEPTASSSSLEASYAKQPPLPPAPAGTVVLNENFEDFSATSVGVSGGGAAQITAAPNGTGGNFGGQFKNQDVTITVPAGYRTYHVAFDLYLIGTWDGSGKQGNHGGDTWQLSVDNGSGTGLNVFHTSFSNQGVNTQHYPRELGAGSSPALSGVDATNRLGYQACGGRCGPKDVSDAMYKLAYVISNPTGGAMTLHMVATNPLQLGQDENWGVDNIVITGTNPVPTN